MFQDTFPAEKNSLIKKLKKWGFEVVSLKLYLGFSIIDQITIRGNFFELTFNQEDRAITQINKMQITEDNIDRYTEELLKIPSAITTLKKEFEFLYLPDAIKYLENAIEKHALSIQIKKKSMQPLEQYYNLLRKKILCHQIPFQMPVYDSILFTRQEDQNTLFTLPISMITLTYNYEVVVGFKHSTPYTKSFTLKNIEKSSIQKLIQFN